jgi:hypothetical protein
VATVDPRRRHTTAVDGGAHFAPEGFLSLSAVAEACSSTAHGSSSPNLHWMRTGIERNRRGRRWRRSLPASPRLKTGEFFSPFVYVMFDSGFFWG